MVSSSYRGVPRVRLLCALVASCFAAEGFANPTGPAVAAGAASFNTVGKTLTITNTPNAIINWKGFSIGAGETTRFQQQGASSAVLNRVVGQDPSAILGTLSSNGKVFLVNPNGVLFGQGSRIDVAGFVASTLNITDPDFLAGRLNFQAGAVAGSIVNQGEIVTASGGRVYLIAPDVQNHGLISSPSGEIVLAAGKTVSLVDADVPNLKVEVQAGGEALNVGKIIADGGKVGIYAGLINQRGIVRADSVSKDATGRIVFKASDTTILDDASVTSAAGAKGGEIQVLGNKVGLVGSARVDASGDVDGGTVLIGGDYQGKNPEVQNAFRTYVGLQSSITADAITSGDGGKVIVWADDATRAYGTISARGGAQSGNGGFVEVSGKSWLDFNASVDTSAPTGITGVLLLDPAAINITNTSDSGGSFNAGNPNIFSSGGSSSTLTWTTIKNHLTGAGGGSNTNVYVTTSGCSTPGSCGIDVLDPSGDLASTNTLRLISHEQINVNGEIRNTGSGALEMFAGWDGTSLTSSPILSDFAGSIMITQPINFAGSVLLRAHAGIAHTASGMITTPNLLASTNFGSVILDNVANAVGTLAGTFADQFFFQNGPTLTIGNVGGVNGITNSSNPSGAPSLVVTVTTGNLIVNSPISVSDGGGSDGTTSITLNAPSISVNNTTVTATADVNDSGDGQPASVILNANTGGMLISNSTVSAIGGQGGGGGDAGGSATVGLNAFGGVTVNSSSTISATGGAGAPDSISGANGGDASVALHAGGTINTSASTLSAAGGAPVNGGTAGVGTVTLEVSSFSGNASPAGDIVVHDVTANNVNLQQQSLNSARSILRASGTSLITATQVLMEADDPGNVGGGSIGTSAAPIRIQAANLEAHTHEGSPGIFIDSPNAGNLQVGGVSFNGSVKGVQNVTSGDISIAANGNLTVLGGLVSCGTATGGPVCTASGNVTLRAEGMTIQNAVSATGTVALAPYSQSRQINIESGSSAGVLSLTPVEISLVATPGTLEIGRSDGNATMVVNTALTSASVNAGTLRLYSGNINLTTGGADIGSSGTPFAHNLELKANNDVQLTVGSIYLADNKNLTVVADNDNSTFGNVNIGGVTLKVGSTGANTGSMTLQGREMNVAVSGGGSGLLEVQGTGAQNISALSPSGTLRFENANTTSGSLVVQALGGPQTISAAGSLQILAGTGTDTSVSVRSAASQTIVAGNLALQAGAAGTANYAVIESPDQDITVHGNLTLTGGGSSASGSANGGARIGGLGGASPTPTSLLLEVDGDVTLTGGSVAGAAIGNAGTPTTPQRTDIDMTVGGNVTLNAGSGSGTRIGSQGANLMDGDISITALNGIVTVTRGSGIQTAGALTIEAAGVTVDATTGLPNAKALVLGGNQTGGNQRITANAITLTGGGSGSNASAEITSNGPQIIDASTIDLTGGEGTGNWAQISAVGQQTITATGAITMIAGGNSNGSQNHAQIIKSGSGLQHVTADSIWLEAGGGATGANNRAAIFTTSGSTASQLVGIGPGGLTMIGGTGSGGDNKAGIWVLADQTTNSGTVATQAVNVSGGGSIEITGGSNALNSPSGSNNNAGIYAAATGIGSSQTVTVAGAGGIELIGGESGISNHANIWNLTPSQTVTAGSGGILLLGDGGTSGTNNRAYIFQEHAAGSQSITVNGGGSILLLGGTGTGGQNFGQILNNGSGLQSITFTAPGSSIFLQGGTGDIVTTASNGNFASIDAALGNQTIRGSSAASDPGIFVFGGDSGGNTGGSTSFLGNEAIIRARNGTQNISASVLEVAAGLSGVDNSATIQAPTQIITAATVTLTGGGTGGNFGGTRLGGIGGNTPGPTNLSLTTTGDVILTGGSVSGASIGANALGGVATAIDIDSGGSVILNPGGSGARIGSPATNMAGGDIFITAVGTFALNSAGGLGTFIRTLGNVTLNAASITQGANSAIIAGGTTSLTGGTISLGSASNDFTGAVGILGTDVTIQDANTLTLGGVEASNLTAGASTINQSAAGIQVSGTTNLNAGAISLTTATNDFGTVNVTSTGNVAITDANAITIGTSSVGGTLDVVGSPVNFSGGLTANNYSFSGGSYTLAAGTYNLGGTTTVASGATVTASGAAVNAGTMNVSGTFDAIGGTLNLGTVNLLAGGTLSGTGTIVGNVNNSAGNVSPGASAGILTINGNYTQGPSGTLTMQIGVPTVGIPVAGIDYDQLKVIGSATLGGTLDTTLLSSTVPAPGTAFTLIDASGGITGIFSAVNQPAGALFNSFYSTTTFQFVAAAATSVPEQIVGTFNQVLVTTEQLSEPLVELIDTIEVSLVPPTTTTTPEGQIVPTPPACN